MKSQKRFFLCFMYLGTTQYTEIDMQYLKEKHPDLTENDIIDNKSNEILQHSQFEDYIVKYSLLDNSSPFTIKIIYLEMKNS